MPKITLGSAAKKAAEYDRKTAEIEEQIISRIAVKHLRHQDIADVLGKSRAAVSYNLKDIDNMRLSDFRKLCSMLDLEIVIQKKQ